MTKHWFGPHSTKSKGKGHPLLFQFSEAPFYDFPEGGGYPKGFLERAYMELGVTDAAKVLHLCSGSVRTGITLDIREEKKPIVVANCLSTPFGDETFQWILADPPYSEEYAKNLYGTESVYPSPAALCKEMSRLLKAGGRCGLLHFQVPMFRKPLRLVKVIGITTGLGYNIRAFSILEKGD